MLRIVGEEAGLTKQRKQKRQMSEGEICGAKLGDTDIVKRKDSLKIWCFFLTKCKVTIYRVI